MNENFMFYAYDFLLTNDFDVGTFINELGDINFISCFDILNNLNKIDFKYRNDIIKNDSIFSKFRNELLKECGSNQWYYYRNLLEIIDVDCFFAIFDFNVLDNYFKNNSTENISVLFAALCEKDINSVIKHVLKEKNLYKVFFEHSDYFSSYFNDIEYDLFLEVIYKMQNDGFELSSDFLGSIKEEYQYEILNNKFINDEVLVFLISSFSNKVKSYFFENDMRALYLYNKFDVMYLVKSGIKFSQDILNKNEFFDYLKSDSLVEFRNNINVVEKYNNPIFIEKKLDKYYDEIISNFNVKEDMFNEYVYVLFNPGDKFSNSFVFDFDVVYRISDSLIVDEDGKTNYKNKDELTQFLKRESSLKLSEVIIDALFRDNIYNVWLNIKEMLRYNDLLDEDKKIIDKNKFQFYKMILDFDNLNNVNKIELYNKLKDKNFSYVFYSDIRNVKNYCYDKIKDSLFNISGSLENIDIGFSNKYGISVYDMRDKEYNMLVRTQAQFKDTVHYKRGCYSIISNESTQVFGEYDSSSFIYGYNTFDSNLIMHMFEKDSFSSSFRDNSSRFVNRIMSSDELINGSSSYNEVQILNKKSDVGRYKWNAKKPDFLVVFDVICNKHIMESKRLGIPIVVITKNKMFKKDFNIDIDGDAYVNDMYNEMENRIRR